MNKFESVVVERLKGENSQTLAAKISKKALNSLKGCISALESKQVDQETAVEEATEALNEAVYVTSQITNSDAYLSGIKTAQSRLDNANQDLSNTKNSLEYWKKLLAELTSEVAA